ncbi:hypothetical protein CYK75_10755 [Clostridium perfringens]|uniref:hypothetical protein n=1 Tax=Clostridium perfringens TaxID=1502 RepID=UPI000D70CDD1|nr:hypothetical protein [Clostridium perfringens]PWW99187.1 hypothetical protein CYK75_10755 [Clostridium perfringens]
MRIESIGFNLFIPKMNNIRQYYNEIEQNLKEYFVTPFTLVPIPDDAPEEIPRIIAKSKNGHSELQISLINVQLNIGFDDNLNFNSDINKCFSYTQERINRIVDTLGKYSNDVFLFSGITTRIIKDNQNPIKFLNDKFLNVKSNVDLYSISNKFTYLLEDKYFLNFNIYNLRTFEGIINEHNIKPEINEISNNLCIEIDMNDKYGFNHNREHLCTRNTIEHIINMIKNNINNNIDMILNNKELVL